MALPASNRALINARSAWGSSWQPTIAVSAPGRLELLGNHIDYSGGPVLAAAIDQRLVVVASNTAPMGKLRLLSGDTSLRVRSIDVAGCRDWRNKSSRTGPGEYVRGVVASLLDRDIEVRDGLTISLAGDIPRGFGMSSSAALCVSTVLLLATARPSDTEIVRIAQEAEHRCGSPVGAMDQSASVAGRVILFDGRDTSFSRLEPNLGDLVFAVADSGVSHALSQSSYPTRVKEATRALEWLNGHLDQKLANLADLDATTWSALRPDFVTDLGQVMARRVDHVVSEVQRVRDGVIAMESGDWVTFGRLMDASGDSSARDYDISHPIVEELVAIIREQPGVLGARMMGGGEGGPALALLHKDAVPELAKHLGQRFFARHSSHLSGDRLQVCSFGPGASIDQAQ